MASYASEINRLKALVVKLQRMQFGQSSEKMRHKAELQTLARFEKSVISRCPGATVASSGVAFRISLY